MYKILKYFFLITVGVGLCISMKPGPARQDDNSIYWSSNHRLTFADFKGSPDNKDNGLQNNNPVNATHRLGTISKSIDVQLNTKGGKLCLRFMPA